MYALPRIDFIKNYKAAVTGQPMEGSEILSPKVRIKEQLKLLGVSRLALLSSEFMYLHQIIHSNEFVRAVVYGWSKDGFVALVATDKRAIYLDKKPLFTNKDEITYDVVSGVKNNKVGIGSSVTLHTRIKDYTIQTFNERCAESFVAFIESRCVERNADAVLPVARREWQL